MMKSKTILFLALNIFAGHFATLQAAPAKSPSKSSASALSKQDKKKKKKLIKELTIGGIAAGSATAIALIVLAIVKYRAYKSRRNAREVEEAASKAGLDVTTEQIMDTTDPESIVDDAFLDKMDRLFKRYGVDLTPEERKAIQNSGNLADATTAARAKLIDKLADTYGLSKSVLNDQSVFDVLGDSPTLRVDPVLQKQGAGRQRDLDKIKSVFTEAKDGNTYVPVDVEKYNNQNINKELNLHAKKILFGDVEFQYYGEVSVEGDFVVLKGGGVGKLAGRGFDYIVGGGDTYRIPKYEVVEQGIKSKILPENIVQESSGRWGGANVKTALRDQLVEKLEARSIDLTDEQIDSLVEKVNAAFAEGKTGKNFSAGDNDFSVTRDEDGDYSIGDHNDDFGDTIPLD